ncbi:type VI secretion system Vgr family protein [Pseudomonas putida]
MLSHNRYLLEIDYVDVEFDVLAFQGNEWLSQPFNYRVEFTTTQRDLAAEQVLREKASLSLHKKPENLPLLGMSRPPVAPLRTLYGVITGFKRLSESRDEVRYEVTLEPRLALLGRGKQYRIYQHQSVPEIVEHILRSRHGFAGQHFLFKLVREYPRREQVMQYGENDLAFITRLLAEVGIWYRFTSDERLHIDVVEFHDDQRHYPSAIELPHQSQSGFDSSGQDAVWQLQTHHRVVEQHINVRAYHYRDSGAHLDAEVDHSRGVTTTYGEGYHYAEPYTTLADPYALDEDLLSESGYFYARLNHERYLNQQTLLSGISSSATLAPGQRLLVVGDAPQAFEPGAVITSMVTRAARDQSFVVTFEALPYSETVCFRPSLPAKPQIAGTVPARVTSSQQNDPYGHIDLEGRYRVNFLFDRDSWKTGAESAWLRLARPYAGDTHGLHLPLICGTEVAVAFEHGDPDRPFIAHALHDSRHPDHVTLRNYHRNVLRTPANNKLRLDDTRGQEHIKLSTEHGGKSQLNLGHLVDSAKQKRGEGFELRSDAWGAIRAGKGLFISAEAQPSASGQVLEMSAAKSRLQQASEQLQQLCKDAQASHAEPADVQAQLDLLRDQLDELKAAVVLLSAPEGIALSSGKHMQLAAQRNLMINAGAEADLSVVKRLFMGVGQGFSLFVRTLGMKLIANQGPVVVQAQNDSLELLARQGLSITSTQDQISITAKKKITLNAGGSYITLEAGGIESGTEGDFNVKSARFEYSGPASMKATHPDYPKRISPQGVTLNIAQAPNASQADWGGMPYTLFADGAVLQKGVLDKTGLLQVDHQVVTGQYRVQLANGVSFQIPVPEQYRNVEQGHLANRGLHRHSFKTAVEVNPLGSNRDHYAPLLGPDQEDQA